MDAANASSDAPAHPTYAWKCPPAQAGEAAAGAAEAYLADAGDGQDDASTQDPDVDDGASVDDDDEADVDDELPTKDDAIADPLYKRMCNYMLAAATSVQANTNLVVTEEAFDALSDWVWGAVVDAEARPRWICRRSRIAPEHLWLPRKGYADNETDPESAAIAFTE